MADLGWIFGNTQTPSTQKGLQKAEDETEKLRYEKMCFLFWKNANWMELLSSYKRQTGLFETRRYGFGDKYVITP